MALVSEQIVPQNIIFRFFLVVYADKGFALHGVYRSNFLNNCFLLLTGTFATYTCLPYLVAFSQKEDYPKNTGTWTRT
jgi:hypothetical protein